MVGIGSGDLRVPPMHGFDKETAAGHVPNVRRVPAPFPADALLTCKDPTVQIQ
jgi:hypothetical protein